MLLTKAFFDVSQEWFDVFHHRRHWPILGLDSPRSTMMEVLRNSGAFFRLILPPQLFALLMQIFHIQRLVQNVKSPNVCYMQVRISWFFVA